MCYPLPACENHRVVHPLRRATAAILACLLTLAPALRAVAARQKPAGVLVLPWTALSAPEASAARFTELLREELHGRFELASLRRHEAVRKRLLAAPRGSVRVLAPQGPGESRVLLDGRPFTAAPLLIKNLIPGEHFLRVERAGTAWGDKFIAIAGAETRIAPQPGELSAALMQDEFDRAADIAARLAREAGAQAAVFGVVMRSGDSLLVKSFLSRRGRVLGLSALTLHVELLGAGLELVRLAD